MARSPAGLSFERPGTLVRLFPQAAFVDPEMAPVTVELSTPAGACRPGPADDRFNTLIAAAPKEPYGFARDGRGVERWSGPPYRGAVLPPAVPGPGGDFDHLEPGDDGFLAAHAYGCARFALDVMEACCGPVPWHFSGRGGAGERLEILCIEGWDNAHCGYGFMELGDNSGERRGLVHPFALNLDTVAHETGHLVLFSHLGFEGALFDNPEFRGFHESMADLVAVLVASHLDAVVDRLLERTRGNLYVNNELARLVELSPTDQIRNLANGVKFTSFAQGWADEHDLSLPLTGAFFDILVEVHQNILVDAGALPPEVIRYSDNLETMQAFEDYIDRTFSELYREDPGLVRAAFLDARDFTGRLLAALWRSLDPWALTYAEVARTCAMIERDLTGGRHARAVSESFAWRGIGRVELGPFLPGLKAERHSLRARAAAPVR